MAKVCTDFLVHRPVRAIHASLQAEAFQDMLEQRKQNSKSIGPKQFSMFKYKHLEIQPDGFELVLDQWTLLIYDFVYESRPSRARVIFV
jgi:hypothetical protein